MAKPRAVSTLRLAGAEDTRSWHERIRCPECGQTQDGFVIMNAGDPWPTYVYGCVACGYVITEFDWDAAGEQTCPSPP